MDEKTKGGYFVISLDFELFWGMLDKVTLASYGARIRGERTAIPRMLAYFKKYHIHATWGTVGMLMARSKTELFSLLPDPSEYPAYLPKEISSYEYLNTASIQESDIHFFGSDLVYQIVSTPFQEIGNHTFSHFYCLDNLHDTKTTLTADLRAHRRVSETYALSPTTIIFPRNQYSDEALYVCAREGIIAYRGNENHILYKPRKDSAQSLFIRGWRLIDHYLNTSGYHTYALPAQKGNLPINIPASRFFRPWSLFLAPFEWLRLHRIKRAMTYAAEHNEVFHLWWHPHNFGINQEQNFKNLENILEHYTYLNKQYGMKSMSMEEIATAALQTSA